MIIVHVVPLRRLPVERAWLSYEWNLPSPPQPGLLVTIPLRQQTLLGVIWEITTTPPDYPIRPVTELVQTQPIVNDWQRRMVTIMATTGACSISDILYSLVPHLSLLRWRKFSPPDISVKVQSSTPVSSEHLWYRQRTMAIDYLEDWARRFQHSQRCLLVPTKEDANVLSILFAHHGLPNTIYDAQVPSTTVLKLWHDVLSQKPLLIIGTMKALGLPWNQPQILVDQIEHHAYKTTAQHPRLDVRVLLTALARPYTWTSPAPTLELFQAEPSQATGQMAPRQLINLTRERGFQWFPDETVVQIDQALAQQQRIVCIAPRRGFAQTMFCRDCSHVVTCPKCQRPASITLGIHHQARCLNCQTVVTTQLQCPHCRSQRWGWRGLGAEHIMAEAQQRWPNTTITPLLDPQVPADIAVDTYTAYHQLYQVQNLGLVIVVNGDALLNIPDYSTAERAWQYAARLSAATPVPVLVQTFRPADAFWQRWLHGDDRAWYSDEVRQREKFLTPPFVQEWMVRWRGPEGLFRSHLDSLQQTYSQHLNITLLPPRRLIWRAVLRWTTSKLPAWSELFPTPWQVDLHPTSWVD